MKLFNNILLCSHFVKCRKYKYFHRDYSHKVKRIFFFFTTYYDNRSEMTENRFDSNILSDFHVVSYECLKHILVNTPVSFQLGDFNRLLSAFNLMKYILEPVLGETLKKCWKSTVKGRMLLKRNMKFYP